MGAVFERITGTEMEYPVSVRIQPADGGHTIDCGVSDRQSAQVLQYCLPPELLKVSDHYQNGARIYKDVGGRIEYSPPEDKKIAKGTVANEIAGERTIEDAYAKGRADERIDGRYEDFSIHKRVLSYDGNPDVSWGYHENYLAFRKHIPITVKGLTLLGLHLATRNLYAGAGQIRQYPDQPHRQADFFIAQKAMSLTLDYSTGTTNKNKPLLNGRDEPHADKDTYVRIHVVSGDPHMSPWAMRMQMGTTSLVLRLMEQGISLDHLELPKDHMHRMAIQVASDLTLHKTVELANGKTIRPMSIQDELLETVIKRLSSEDLTEDEIWTIGEWARALDVLDTDPMKLVDADWVLKKYLLDKNPEKADEINMKFDSLDPGVSATGKPRSLGLHYRKTLWKKWMPDEALIQERMFNPPEATRARVRSEIIRLLHAKGITSDVALSWTTLQLNQAFPGQAGHTTKYEFDPYDTEVPPELLHKLQRLQACPK